MSTQMTHTLLPFLKGHLETSTSLTGHTKPSYRRAYKRTDLDAIAKIPLSQHSVQIGNVLTTYTIITLSVRYVALWRVPDKSSTELLEKASELGYLIPRFVPGS